MLIVCKYQIRVIFESCYFHAFILLRGRTQILILLRKEISESENGFQPGRSVLGWEHAVLNCPHSAANVYESWVPMPLPFIDSLGTEAAIHAIEWQIFFKKVWAENVELHRNDQCKVSRVIPPCEITEMVAKCNFCSLGKLQSFDNCFCPRNIQAIRNVHKRH